MNRAQRHKRTYYARMMANRRYHWLTDHVTMRVERVTQIGRNGGPPKRGISWGKFILPPMGINCRCTPVRIEK